MKTLEQLGISPAPWNVNEYNNIVTCYGHTLAATIISDAYSHDRTEKDACLMEHILSAETMERIQDFLGDTGKAAKAAKAKNAGPKAATKKGTSR